jgi:restriction system protein
MAKKRQSEFTKWMGPTLDALRKLGGSGSPQEVSDAIADTFKIPDKKKEELTASGIPRFHNQVCWARQYLVWEGYIESSKRGVWALSSSGYKKYIKDEEAREIFLKWVEIFAHRRKAKQNQGQSLPDIETMGEVDEAPPQKANSYREELISILRSLSPRGFEELCLLLLRENGFENLKLTSRGRDNGIDGISTLRINPFVSFKVLIQCKRYNKNNSIKREQVGDFRNAMMGRADKGIFITTGYFSGQAEREANREGVPPIELVDCEKLIEMFEKSELGLKPVTTYEIEPQFFEKYMEDSK